MFAAVHLAGAVAALPLITRGEWEAAQEHVGDAVSAATSIEQTGVSCLRSNNRSPIVEPAGRRVWVRSAFSLVRAVRPGNVSGGA